MIPSICTKEFFDFSCSVWSYVVVVVELGLVQIWVGLIDDLLFKYRPYTEELSPVDNLEPALLL